MIRVENLSKSYPTGTVLRGVTWQVNPGERVGLIGANGAGKSTFLKILTGEIDPDGGKIIFPPRRSIGYLPQELVGNFSGTLDEEMWAVFEKIRGIGKALEEIAHSIEETKDPEALHELVEKQSRLQLEFEMAEGYTAETRIGRVLFGLGFKPEDRRRPMREFSGGWQMRAALARLLLASPDLLLLDEPTNHLDVTAIEWLEDYLADYPGAVLLISHDRMFLDSVVNRISELENGHFGEYSGTYSDFVEEKEARRESASAAHDRQKKEITRQEATIERFRFSATRSRQAKSREKQLSKIERIQLPRPIPKIFFRFPVAPPSGNLVLSGERLAKRYENLEVFSKLSFELRRGDRLVLVGPNGCGKSTLLRLILGEEEPSEGLRSFGHNVKVGYYSQQQADSLEGSNSVLDEAYLEAPDWKLGEVRNLLARFLFKDEEVFKKVSQLSGGEKSRLALAKLLLHPANLLVLDEPTNHLDIASKDILASALVSYQGTVILVSHDRYLLDQIATRVLAFEDKRALLYDGDYAYYRLKKEEQLLAKASEKKEAEKKEKKESKGKKVPLHKALLEVEEIEARIMNLEEEIALLEERMADPSLYVDPESAQETTQRYQQAKLELEGSNALWMERIAGI
ncbi:MAG TPA: lysophospholipase [Cyanobacteria bacterium UBA8530]|nr:lysophospholipase [Cyanobacteria bacterium UBA8530]